MKVFNLTDVPTEVLEIRGLVNANISVGGVTIEAGKGAVIPKWAYSEMVTYVNCGALCVGDPPAEYEKKKATQKPAVPAPSAPPPPVVAVFEEPPQEVVETLPAPEVVETADTEPPPSTGKKKKHRW